MKSWKISLAYFVIAFLLTINPFGIFGSIARFFNIGKLMVFFIIPLFWILFLISLFDFKKASKKIINNIQEFFSKRDNYEKLFETKKYDTSSLKQRKSLKQRIRMPKMNKVFDWKEKTNRKMVKKESLYALLVSYIIIVVPIFLFHYELAGFLSFGWLFLPFIITGLLFYFFRIDPKYLILSAILLIWIRPFLLIYDITNIVEATAIYAFYFLIIGVLLLLIESKTNGKVNIKFESLKEMLFNKSILFLFIFWAILFAGSYFFNLANISKAISLYVATTLLIAYLGSKLCK